MVVRDLRHSAAGPTRQTSERLTLTTGTLTRQEKPSFARRDNVRVQRSAACYAPAGTSCLAVFYPSLAAVAATWPASEVMNAFKLVISDRFVKSPVVTALRSAAMTAAVV